MADAKADLSLCWAHVILLVLWCGSKGGAVTAQVLSTSIIDIHRDLVDWKFLVSYLNDRICVD